jgi:hypothetical protein
MPIGTTAAIAIALGTAGAQAGMGIYSAKKTSETNKLALETEEKNAAADREFAATEAQRQRDFQASARQEAIAYDQGRWNDYVRAHEPYWQTGQAVYGNLLDLAGLDRGAAPPASTGPVAGGRPTNAAPSGLDARTPGMPAPSGPSGPPMALGQGASLYDMAQAAGRPAAGPAPPSRWSPRMATQPPPQGGSPNWQSLLQLAQLVRDPIQGRPLPA